MKHEECYGGRRHGRLSRHGRRARQWKRPTEDLAEQVVFSWEEGYLGNIQSVEALCTQTLKRKSKAEELEDMHSWILEASGTVGVLDPTCIQQTLSSPVSWVAFTETLGQHTGQAGLWRVYGLLWVGIIPLWDNSRQVQCIWGLSGVLCGSGHWLLIVVSCSLTHSLLASFPFGLLIPISFSSHSRALDSYLCLRVSLRWMQPVMVGKDGTSCIGKCS